MYVKKNFKRFSSRLPQEYKIFPCSNPCSKISIHLLKLCVCLKLLSVCIPACRQAGLFVLIQKETKKYSTFLLFFNGIVNLRFQSCRNLWKQCTAQSLYFRKSRNVLRLFRNQIEAFVSIYNM